MQIKEMFGLCGQTLFKKCFKYNSKKVFDYESKCSYNQNSNFVFCFSLAGTQFFLNRALT